MKKHKVSAKSLDNLVDKSAPDKPGGTIPITVRVTPEQKEWLDKQVEGRSFHAREAFRAYIPKN